jgi:phage shock protein A
VGVLDRVSTILRANINSLLDSAEDPERMIDQIIRDMEEAIKQARGQVAEMIAEEKRLKAEADHNRQLAANWSGKAELAVRKNADDLALEALRREKDYQANAEVYNTQWQGQRDIVEKLKGDLQALQIKYEGARRDRDALIARHRRAAAQQRITQLSSNFSTVDPTAELTRMEERIRREEALAAAHVELAGESYDKRFDELEADSDLDRRLAELKSRVQGQLPSPEGAQE